MNLYTHTHLIFTVFDVDKIWKKISPPYNCNGTVFFISKYVLHGCVFIKIHISIYSSKYFSNLSSKYTAICTINNGDFTIIKTSRLSFC